MGESRPLRISSEQGWRRHPEKVWAWYLWRHYLMQGVDPNNGQWAVAAWQDHAEVHVITQNVDNLHERAGSQRVYHLHGSLFEFRCDRCQREYRGALPDMPEPVETVPPPECECGGLIRPNVVWFGEPARYRLAEVGRCGRQRRRRSWSDVLDRLPAAACLELALANGTGDRGQPGARRCRTPRRPRSGDRAGRCRRCCSAAVAPR